MDLESYETLKEEIKDYQYKGRHIHELKTQYSY